MTREDFEKAISAFDDTEAFLCAAHVDGGLAVAANGSAERISRSDYCWSGSGYC